MDTTPNLTDELAQIKAQLAATQKALQNWQATAQAKIAEKTAQIEKLEAEKAAALAAVVAIETNTAYLSLPKATQKELANLASFVGVLVSSHNTEKQRYGLYLTKLLKSATAEVLADMVDNYREGYYQFQNIKNNPTDATQNHE